MKVQYDVEHRLRNGIDRFVIIERRTNEETDIYSATYIGEFLNEKIANEVASILNSVPLPETF